MIKHPSSSFPSEHLAAIQLGHGLLAGGNPQRCSAGIVEPELASGIWDQLLAELICFLKLLGCDSEIILSHYDLAIMASFSALDVGIK